MLKVVGCFVEAHDHRLVGVAAVICAVAACTAIELLCYARRAKGRSKWVWLAVASVAGGSGIWATHFVAMLAFAPGLPSAYDLSLTALSLVAAVLVTGLGFALAVTGGGRLGEAFGGAVVGGGIAAMHYTGMGAYEVAGRLSWDAALVVTSIVIGAALGAAALMVALGGATRSRKLSGALLLLLAIVGHHFTAMGAVAIAPDPTLIISDSAIATSWLAAGVTLASLTILVLAGAALALDIRDRRQAARENDRLQSLANAAVEGLVVYRDGAIVSANLAFRRLAGLDVNEPIAGRAIADYLTHTEPTADGREVETELRQRDGSSIPVEIIVQTVEYANAPHLAAAMRDLRARHRAEREIHFLAHHDALTGLANRATLGARLEQDIASAATYNTKLAVLCLDLDRFKEVNDLFGHAAGDALLRRVAEIVGGLLDPTQLMARLGGDEFAIVTPCNHPLDAGLLAERVLEAFAKDRSGPAPAATSIGIAVYPDNAQDAASLLQAADTALYRAKQEGRATYRYFEQRMGEEVRERRLLEHDLRHAVGNGELELVYQPQTDISSQSIVGFEALLRWNHPVRGYVPPDRFIPVAEESGAIVQIGEWVLREACREAAVWKDELTIAVNVSAVQVHCGDLAATVHRILYETGLAARRLELEITETALIREPARALHTLRRLKALGVRIAMDDFGTGYSSLSNLRSFPFDKLKIDRSFIKEVHANEQAAAIVSSVLVLGEGLKLPILAEGVETADELAFLALHNCQGAQGYLFGRPAAIATYGAVTGKPRTGEAEAILAA